MPVEGGGEERVDQRGRMERVRGKGAGRERERGTHTSGERDAREGVTGRGWG